MKEPKYYSLYQKIRTDILNGVYAPGERLPSKRTTADKNGCSLITVENAYAMLENEGYIFSKERKGYFVATLSIRPTAQAGKAIGILHHLPQESASVSGKTGERSVWFRTVRRVLTEYGEKLFEKAPGQGCAVLRNAIADYLLRYRGMVAEPKRIVIGSGAEQLYGLTVKLLGREKIFGIESPGYEPILAVYRSEDVRVCPLRMGEDGIEAEELKKPFDVLHVTPFHSFPSGISTSVSKRLQYLSWAEEKGHYLVEDDFDSEFYQPGHPMETIFSSDKNGSVIYINTFSKSISPAVRIGYMILPDPLLKKYSEIFGSLSCSVPVMDQYILAEFISCGSFERHLNRIRREMIRSNGKKQ